MRVTDGIAFTLANARSDRSADADPVQPNVQRACRRSSPLRHSNLEFQPIGQQGQVLMIARFHAFFTTTDPTVFDTVTADQVHRRHAIIEQVHADLKNSALAHLPSGVFTANARLKQREPELLDLMLAISGAVARTALLACARPLPDSRSDSCIEGAAYLGCRSRESVQSPRCVRPEDERGSRSDSGLGASSSSAHLREYLRPEAMSGHAPRSRRTL